MVLAKVLAPKLLIVSLFAASAVYIHLRGRRRHKFWRQLTDHSTFTAPVNVFMYAFSAVPNTPLQQLERFPHLAKLKDNWQILREEGMAACVRGDVKASERYDDLGFNTFFRTGWKRFYLKWYDEPLPSARVLSPRSVALLESIPEVRGAMFAMLPAGARLGEHRDPYAGSLRYHLGLVTPNDDRCRIYVDGVPYSWRDGEAVLFDETYIHSAINETTHDRLILFCDVARPMRYRFADAFNRFLAWHVLRETATRNAAGDRVGLLNRLFGHAIQIRLLGQRLKARNRRLYYIVKVSLIVGLAALIIL